MDAVKEQFEAGVKVVQSLAKNGGTFQPSTSMMLTFYSLYKQATLGECNTSRPSFYDPIGRAKWDAWKQLGNMPSDVAMKEYVEQLKKIVEAMPQTEVVQDFVEKLGNFYEMVDESDANEVSSVGVTKNAHVKRQDHDNFKPESQFLSNGHVADAARAQAKGTNRNGRNEGRSATGVAEGDLVATGRSSKASSKHQHEFLQNFERHNEIENGDDSDDDDDDDDDDNDVGDGISGENSGKAMKIFSQASRESGEAFDDDDEFCDTTDILTHEDERTSSFLSPTSSGIVGGDRAVAFRSASVQTDRPSTASAEVEVVRKMDAAVEEMRRELVELKEEVKKLDPLYRAKVYATIVFNFLRRYGIPKACFYIVWPVVIGLLFRRVYRLHTSSS